ncbi:hypothetical protein JTE90_023285 [Oedothorax gibbosus]|uniref:Uncharacterized protein n=1 Tax=Oedothorax gibbosus TaxID=931172 RepID=A0AAV6UMQ8_9ARAC|nr:hypothetical protein JTE90_023285 [Oedothorax gibbosus]
MVCCQGPSHQQLRGEEIHPHLLSPLPRQPSTPFFNRPRTRNSLLFSSEEKAFFLQDVASGLSPHPILLLRSFVPKYSK